MEPAPENDRRASGLPPETHFSESAACRVSRRNRSHAAARACTYPRAISSRQATDFTAWSRVATGLLRSCDRWGKALSFAPVSSNALRTAFHLSLSTVPARFSARAQDQAHGGMSRLLPRAQRRPIRCAVSVEAREIVAAVCYRPIGAPYSSSGFPFSAFSPRNLAWIKMSISPSITACTLLVSAPVR